MYLNSTRPRKFHHTGFARLQPGDPTPYAYSKYSCLILGFARLQPGDPTPYAYSKYSCLILGPENKFRCVRVNLRWDVVVRRVYFPSCSSPKYLLHLCPLWISTRIPTRRRVLLKLMHCVWFDRIIIVFIMLNSLVLALTDYGNISTDPDSIDYRSPVSTGRLTTLDNKSDPC